MPKRIKLLKFGFFFQNGFFGLSKTFVLEKNQINNLQSNTQGNAICVQLEAFINDR